MKWTTLLLLALVAVVGCSEERTSETVAAPASQSPAIEVPIFEVDPSWLKTPDNWVLGQIADVHVDAQDHVWVLHRPRTAKPERPTDIPAPSVWEVDPSGNVIQSWGGPGDFGYEWPGTEHGIFATHDGYVWITGHQPDRDHHLLKFTKDGEFVMQIGRRGQSRGNADTQNVNRAASVWVHAKTNELFVGDGYGNRRVIVFDAETGAFKRMWGAFGNVPEERKPGESPFSSDDTGDGPPQFNNPHNVKVSNDDLVYVADRDNQRVQVFTLDGEFVSQVFISRGKMPPSTFTGMAFGKPRNEIADELLADPASAARLAFSPDPEQRFLYVGDRRTEYIYILERRTLEILGTTADGAGDQPGQLYIFHGISTDSTGNIYTAETQPNIESEGGLVGRPGASGTSDPYRGNRRVQKFVFKGFGPGPASTQ